jgi:hypothetical protein
MMKKEKNISLDSLRVDEKINLREMEKRYNIEKGLERRLNEKEKLT